MITYTYQWQRSGTDIPGATAPTYTLVTADVGNTVSCVVTATNSIGSASANSNSTATVSAGVPGAPTIGIATATGTSTATVAYTAPASNGGATIISYTATSSPGNLTATLTQAGGGIIVVTGLVAGTAYTFTVTALNSIGTSDPSAASNSVTEFAPAPPPPPRPPPPPPPPGPPVAPTEASSSTLTPLQITAGSGLLQNSGLEVAQTFRDAINRYNSSSPIAPLRQAMIALGSTYPNLYSIGIATCPALGDSVPAGYALSTTPTGWVDSFIDIANFYLGNGDLTIFAQAESICQAYISITNSFINTAVNSQTYLGGTFTNTNNMISGDITQVSLSTQAWGADLTNLGQLINLAALDELGSPLALVRQMAAVGAVLPQIAIAFDAEGVPLDVISGLGSPTLVASNRVQKLMYAAMTKITGPTLDQILSVYQVKTAGITTMADLLNPIKLFPGSFQTLTVTVNDGSVQNIYRSGTVNSALKTQLPRYVTAYLDQLSQIIPPDQALANQALSTSMRQITGIGNMSLPDFAAAVLDVQSMFGLPLVNAQTSAVPASAAAFYAGNIALGTSVNNTFVITDFLGTAIGIIGTEELTITVGQLGQMDVSTLALIYQQMTEAASGALGPVDSGPIVISAGPAAGSYVGVEVPPVPPVPDPPPAPTYDPTAVQVVIPALIAAAEAEIVRLVTAFPAQTTELNRSWQAMAQKILDERANQRRANLIWGDLIPDNKPAVMSMIQRIPDMGFDTAEGGNKQFFEELADQAILPGQAVIGLLRQGPTTAGVSLTGIGTNNNIPEDPATLAPQAQLSPTTYPAG